MGIAEEEVTTLAAISRLPVFMRVGDGPEYEVGTLEPEAADLLITPDGTATVQVSAMMPRFFRAVADAFEGVPDGQ